jgi:hypothetical protein
MLSKMAGARYGIARGAKPVLTRIIKGDLPERWLDGLQMIYDHIIANNNQGKAVVSMAVSIKKWYVSEGWINRFSYILQQLVLQGAFIVTGSGNSAVPVDGYPGLYGDPNSAVAVPQLLVVGGVDKTGGLYSKSQTASWVTLFAPAVDIHCATSDGGTKPNSRGTSDGMKLFTHLIKASFSKYLSQLKH